MTVHYVCHPVYVKVLVPAHEAVGSLAGGGKIGKAADGVLRPVSAGLEDRLGKGIVVTHPVGEYEGGESSGNPQGQTPII